jgi:hypothetical protein
MRVKALIKIWWAALCLVSIPLKRSEPLPGVQSNTLTEQNMKDSFQTNSERLLITICGHPYLSRILKYSFSQPNISCTSRYEGMRGRGSIFPQIPNLGTRWGWAFTLKSCPFHPRNPLNKKVSGPEIAYGRFKKLPFPSIEPWFLLYTFLASHFIDWAIPQIFLSLEQNRLGPSDHYAVCTMSASNHPKFRTVYPA